MEHEETIRELVDFTMTVGRTLQNHRETLARHESILAEEFKAGETHRDAILALRKDVSALSELVAAQSTLIAAMQRTLVKIASDLGMNPGETAADTIN
jgi:hypothetical protein